MTLKKVVSTVAFLACATPAFAEAPQQSPKEKMVWITIGSDALATVRESFKSDGVELSAPLREKGGVVALRLPESQIVKLAGVIHSKLNRCAGFVAHDSETQALEEVERATTAALAPAPSAVSYFINNGPSVNAMLSGVAELNIRNTINSLSTNYNNRYYNVQSGKDAATWLQSQWTTIASGRSDISVALFTHTWTQPSVIATITGTTLPNEVVVLGGHLDSINQSSPTTGKAPGADDDASGVASITEAFRVAVANGYKPARTVKFMAYAGEEVGLYGSKAIANSFKSSGVNVVGVLQLDMTNYKGSSYDFGMVTDNTNATLNSFTTSLISTYIPGTTYTNITCGYACSDHASWYSAGYPSTMPFEATMTTDNPQIHTTGDTLTYMGGTATNSVKFAKLAVSFLGELAKGATTGNTPPPTDGGGTGGNTLTNGVESAQYSGAKSSMTCWTLTVPSGKTSLVFNTAGKTSNTGDSDLYVRFNAEPTTGTYNCKSEGSTNTESCSVTNPSAGTWYACSYGYSAYTNVTMKGTY
ncbi:M20/M25/M40 family metallo-hydrolase [Hyalangium versicolor]|uniref:M20/M25/M40 family metallo-hydrolase n=1 Tax=Hyalangium versicolor TaxID=2861190 RepID=UPI001CCAC1F3|nr:M20/M25/M40 family metallo-hydrolase [Hyalangium versicolor]